MKFFIYTFLTFTICISGATTKEEVKHKTAEAAAAAANYSKEQKEAFQKDMEVKLAAVKNEIVELKAKASEKTGKAQVEMKEQVASLEAHQSALKKDLEKLKKSSGNAWSKIKVGMSKAWDSLSASYKKAKEEFKESE